MSIRSLFTASMLLSCNDKGDDTATGTDDRTPFGGEDADEDGFAAAEDCNDRDAAIHPGAEEVCDGIDNDCDNTTDVDASDASAYYIDGDADTYGAGTGTMSCEVVKGLVTNDDDCDDTNAAIHPGAVEVCDPLDTDEDCDSYADNADDSFDPSTATLMLYLDDDGDGYGTAGAKVAGCDEGGGFSSNADDCDDANAATHPFAAEVCDDEIDDDCDGVADACRFEGELDPEDADGRLLGSGFLQMGNNITSAGDMDGDGFDDVGVATVNGDGAFVFAGPIRGAVNLADAMAGFERSSTDEQGVGRDVQGIGDQNGDGYDDLLVSAPDANFQAGIGYFVLGPVSGTETIDTVADATASGEGSGDNLSLSPSAGDVNGDGIVDTMMGDNHYGGGVAYVFFGPVTSGDRKRDDAGATFLSNSISYRGIGACNAANGDVDGDGVADVLVSAALSDDEWTGDGLAFLFYGPVSGSYGTDEADTRFTGGGANYVQLGWFSSLGGDNDGDGLDDVVLSAPGMGDGDVYVVFSADVTSVSDYPMSDAGANIAGDPASDAQFGAYLDNAGDLDGDGIDDLASGAFSTGLGTAWMFYGPIAGSMQATRDAAFVMYGSNMVNGFGANVFVNDVTGDGFDDLAIGAYGAMVGGGMVMVFNGTGG